MLHSVKRRLRRGGGVIRIRVKFASKLCHVARLDRASSDAGDLTREACEASAPSQIEELLDTGGILRNSFTRQGKKTA